MAISLPFSVTIKSSVQMMQKLATMMAIDRMMNVAIFSSLSALNRFLFSSFQSRTRRSSRPADAWPRCRGAHLARRARRRSTLTSIAVTLAVEVEKLLRDVERHVGVARVVLVHAAVEDGGDAELAAARHDAHRAEIAERRDERDLVADVDVQRLGELAPEHDARVDVVAAR